VDHMIKESFTFLVGKKANAQRSDDIWVYDIAAQQYTWIKGSGSSPPRRGNFNITKNQLSPKATPGGREFAASFYDSKEKQMFVFGGTTESAHGSEIISTNTMYCYDFDSGLWMFVSGTPSPFRMEPGGGYSFSFGLFSPKGQEGTEFYPQPTTFMGYRYDHATRMFYTFGGLYGTNPNIQGTQGMARFNDLWRFNVKTKAWAWMGGSGQGSYNSLAAVGSATRPFDDFNYPGARGGCALLIDSKHGQAYIFGGYGYGASTLGSLNDLWVFDFAKKQFAFIKGGKDPSTSSGVFGYKNHETVRAQPKPRWQLASACDMDNGYIYIFGGQNMKQASQTQMVYYYDGWRYNIATKNWAWISGGSEPDYEGNYGTMGVPKFSGSPPGKAGMAYWYDYDNKYFYVHGGRKNPNDEFTNDLFNFVDDVSERLFVLSTQSIGSLTKLPTKTRSKRFAETADGFSRAPSPVLLALSNPLIIVAIIFAFLIICGAVAMLLYTRQKDKEAGFDSFFASTAGNTVADKLADTEKPKKSKGSTMTEGEGNAPTATAGSVTDLQEDNITVVVPAIAPGFEIDRSKFIVGQKVGSQNGVPIFSGSAASEELKQFGEHLHIKFFGEAMATIRKSQQQMFWDEVSLLISFRDYKVIARVIYIVI